MEIHILKSMSHKSALRALLRFVHRLNLNPHINKPKLLKFKKLDANFFLPHKLNAGKIKPLFISREITLLVKNYSMFYKLL